MNCINGPLEYLSEIADFRRSNSSYTWDTLFTIAFLAIGLGCNNPYEIAVWTSKEEEWLISLGLVAKSGRKPPSQATIFRFFAFLGDNFWELETEIRKWTRDSLQVLRPHENLGQGNFETAFIYSRSETKAPGKYIVMLIQESLTRLKLTPYREQNNGNRKTNYEEILIRFSQDVPPIKWCYRS